VSAPQKGNHNCSAPPHGHTNCLTSEAASIAKASAPPACITHPFTIILYALLSLAQSLASSTVKSLIRNAFWTPFIQLNHGLPLGLLPSTALFHTLLTSRSSFILSKYPNQCSTHLSTLHNNSCRVRSMNVVIIEE
jgi:hypothetical protein